MRILRLTRRRSDRGYALPAVLGLGIVLLILAGTAATATSTIQQKAQTDSDWTAAYYAATAGLSDYQSRLASISNYNLYGNRDAKFSQGSAPLSLPGRSDPLYNPAFDIQTGSSAVWAQVPCRTSGCTASTRISSFRYEVNTKDFSSRGIIHVRSTGMVGTTTRSVIADFRRNGLFNFVYYTNYEIQDPNISGDDPACASYAWSSPARASSCTLVQFGPYDYLQGDIFSNDQFYICGAEFAGRVQSAAPTGYPAYTAPGGCSDPRFDLNGGTYQPENVASISLPPSNATLSTEARADKYTGAAPGCMYTGPTTIKMNSDGTITVISPLTKVTEPSYTAGTPSLSPSTCGTLGTGTNGLGSLTGSTFTPPADNLIYVQSSPTDATDPNYTAVGSTTGWTGPTSNATTYSCWGQSGKGYSNASTPATQTIAGWKLTKTGPGGGTIQYPATGEDYVPTPTGSAAYQCTAGDAYVSGSFKGHLTIATDRNIYVTDNITYAATPPANSTYNLLGLVANVAMVIWNPQDYVGQTCVYGFNRGNCNYNYWVPSTSNLLTDQDRSLTAAALAVKGTIMVQNYNVGSPRGTLNLVGSIEQNFRGTVATGSGNAPSTGYKKNYVYDTNLRYNAPPKYLAPQNATFAVSQVASVPRAFNADGSPNP